MAVLIGCIARPAFSVFLFFAYGLKVSTLKRYVVD